MLTDRFDRMLMLAVAASVFSCITGIYGSYYLNASTGGCIVFAQSLVFLVVLTLAPKRGLLAQARSRRALQAAPDGNLAIIERSGKYVG
jgi:manganese transport system permease protein